MVLHMLSFLCGMLSNLGFPQKDTLRQGIKCKWFFWEMIPGSTNWGAEKWDRKRKEANKWCINQLVTDGVRWSGVSLKSVGRLCNTQSFPNWRRKLPGYLSTNSSQSLVECCLGGWLILCTSSILHMLLRDPKASRRGMQMLAVASRTSMCRVMGQTPTSREIWVGTTGIYYKCLFYCHLANSFFKTQGRNHTLRQVLHASAAGLVSCPTFLCTSSTSCLCFSY